jgi:hypothetical protein
MLFHLCRQCLDKRNFAPLQRRVNEVVVMNTVLDRESSLNRFIFHFMVSCMMLMVGDYFFFKNCTDLIIASNSNIKSLFCLDGA